MRNTRARGGSDCFGQDCVIVTHSTWALLADAAMSIAAHTASGSGLPPRDGALSVLASLVRAHVLLLGAIGASETADPLAEDAPPSQCQYVYGYVVAAVGGRPRCADCRISVLPETTSMCGRPR